MNGASENGWSKVIKLQMVALPNGIKSHTDILRLSAFDHRGRLVSVTKKIDDLFISLQKCGAFNFYIFNFCPLYIGDS